MVDFKRLNIAIDRLEDRTKELNPKGNRGCYINVAKLLKEKIFTSSEIERAVGNIWNTSIALATHQDKRVEYENKLVMAIEMGFVATYSQLKEAITKL